MTTILLGLRQRAQQRPRLAALEEHGAEIVVGVEEPDRGITIPEPQALDLLLALHVRHAELQHCGRPGRQRHRCDPRATRLVALEWDSERQGPSLFQGAEGIGEPSEPGGALREVAAGNREALRDGDRHDLHIVTSGRRMVHCEPDVGEPRACKKSRLDRSPLRGGSA